MGVARLGGGIAGIREIVVRPVTMVIRSVALLRWHVVGRVRSRFLERLIDFLQDLVSPIANCRPYA